jgi:hypothetical protein
MPVEETWLRRIPGNVRFLRVTASASMGNDLRNIKIVFELFLQ